MDGRILLKVYRNISRSYVDTLQTVNIFRFMVPAGDSKSEIRPRTTQAVRLATLMTSRGDLSSGIIEEARSEWGLGKEDYILQSPCHV